MSPGESPKPTEKKPVEKGKDTVPAMVPETPTLMDHAASDSSSSPAPSIEPGQLLGKYELRQKLGQGGMGAVYLAFDPMIEREVAIKILPPNIAANQELLQRFLTEARSTGKLNHPNVVAIYDIGQQDSMYYIVMEVLTGGSLENFQMGADPQAWREVCEIVAQASDGLSIAHAKGLVHRDIKPENLMRSDMGVVKVVDFGLSKLLDAADDTRDALTKVGQILGTPQYMSPEQFQGQAVDFRTDIYALGGTLFRLLTGKLPYHDCATIIQVMYAHLEQPAPDPCQFIAELPIELRDIIARCMAKSAADRYQDASEIAAELRKLLSQTATRKTNPKQPLAGTPRPLKNVIIVEPAKLPAMMLKNTLTKAGAESVRVCQQASEAHELIGETVPDVLVTANQLKTYSGQELLSQLSDDDRLKNSMLVLNSSDGSPEILLSTRSAGAMAVVSKRAKPDELLRAIHACSDLQIQSEVLGAAFDTSTIRTIVSCDTERIPDRLAELFRQTGLLNLDVIAQSKFAQWDHGKSIGEHDLVLIVQTGLQIPQDAVKQISNLPETHGTFAVLQSNDGEIRLRAVRREAFSAATDLTLDEQRLIRLLQITR